ncbi:hypothetical protein vseg_010194 [Gypsophila vaccaria]
MIGRVGIAVGVVIGCYIYKALKPPPPKICGTPNGPPVASPRIKLKDGRSLAYKECGVSKDEAAYKIVVIHGFDSSKDHPLSVSQELIEELRLYFLHFDRAGYGESDPYPKRSVKSDALDIQELVDALQLGSKFYLIGISMGGYPVWSCLKYIPQRLAGVSLVVPMVHYWWPNFPSEVSTKAMNKLPGVYKWTFRVAHYAPLLFYWWMTQKLFPSLSITSADASISFGQSDLEILQKVSQVPQSDAQKKTTQQGEYESLHRDMIVGYRNWEFSPLDLNNPLEGKNKGVHIWQGYKDKIIPYEINSYISKQLEWINYHEVSEGGHLFILEQNMCDSVIRALVLASE